MSKTSRVLGLFSVSLVVAIGCSDGESQTDPMPPGQSAEAGAGDGGEAAIPPPPPPSRTPEEFCSAYAELGEDWCDYIDHCCSAEDVADLFFIPGACLGGHQDQSVCLSRFREQEQRGVHFDGTAVDDCVKGLSELFPPAPVACGGLERLRWDRHDQGLHGFSQLAACRRMYSGTKRQGEGCEYQSECAMGLVCAPRNLDTSQDYICLPEGARGAPCISDGQCRADLFCVGLDDRHCDVPAPLGADCLYTSECQLGLTCSSLGRCANVVGVGQYCGETSACTLDATCSFQTDTCVAQAQPGQACTLGCDGRCENGTCVTTCGGGLY
jgi:hypothetical protein